MAHTATGMKDARAFEILDGIPIGVLVVDREGEPYYANPAAISLLGTAVGRPGPDDVPSSLHQAFVAGTDQRYPTADLPMERALAGEASHIDDMEIHTTDGTIAVEVWGHPLLDDDGTVVNAAAVFSDITVRKQAESDLAARGDELGRLNAELTRSNDELDQFAHIASHDLSEPLRSISGFVQLLGRRYEGQLDDEADHFIARTVEGTVRMQALISDLLSYSEVARTRVPFVEVDCRGLMATTLETLSASAGEHGTDIVVGQMPMVLGNPARLRQLFQNVVGNAVKFSATADAPRVTVDARRAVDVHEFSVTDNGIGIEPQYRERVFRMFQRLNRREEFGGTGIGLPIAKKIVEMHGGRIWADDAPGGGTVIRFTLRAARGSA